MIFCEADRASYSLGRSVQVLGGLISCYQLRHYQENIWTGAKLSYGRKFDGKRKEDQSNMFRYQHINVIYADILLNRKYSLNTLVSHCFDMFSYLKNTKIN